MKLFIKLLAFRIFNALIVRSYYAPDEYWQAPEIAHSDVFGYGYRTWEWTQEDPIRSPLYHLPISLIFSIFKIFQIDYAFLVAYSPRVISAFYAAIFDFYVVKIFEMIRSEKVEEIKENKRKHISKTTILIVLYCNWFSLFAMPRTIINSFETMLFAISFFHWENYVRQFREEDRNIHNKNYETHNLLCRIFVGVNFVARPTSIIPWVFIWPYELYQRSYQHFVQAKKAIGKIGEYQNKSLILELTSVIFVNIVSLVLMSLFSVAIDIIYYQKVTWSAFNFLKFNLLQGGAELYGVHSLSWYFIPGLPYLMLGFTPHLLYGVWLYISEGNQNFNKINHKKQYNFRILLYVLFVMAFLSLSKHKEDRFLLPLFPILLPFAALGLHSFQNKGNIFFKSLTVLAILSNLLLFFYIGFIHNSGALNVMEFLRSELPNARSENKIQVAFFTECHQTPFHSFVHVPYLEMSFPDCSPENRRTYSESMRLFKESYAYISQQLTQISPQYIVMYDSFLKDEQIENLLLKEHNFEEIYKRFHSYSVETPYGNIDNVSMVLLKKNQELKSEELN